MLHGIGKEKSSAALVQILHCDLRFICCTQAQGGSRRVERDIPVEAGAGVPGNTFSSQLSAGASAGKQQSLVFQYLQRLVIQWLSISLGKPGFNFGDILPIVAIVAAIVLMPPILRMLPARRGAA